MNNPADAVANLLLLSRDTNRLRDAAVVAGALIPNLAIIVAYAWITLHGTPETVSSSVEYYRLFRQGLIDSCNSIPLLLLAMLALTPARWPLLPALFASMLRRRWIAALRSII